MFPNNFLAFEVFSPACSILSNTGIPILTDSFSDRETALRIKYHIDIRPVCETCGKPVKMNIRLGVNSPK